LPNINDVQVIIDVQQPTPRLGFGKPLILGDSVDGSAYKTYSDLAGVAADFANTTEIYKAAAALFGQGDDSPAEIAVVTRKTGAPAVTLDDILPTLFLLDWYFLVYTGTAVADIIKIAAAVEADNSREFFTRTSSKTDLATIFAGGYDRTTVFYHNVTETAKYPEAAWIGRAGSAPVGSLTWKFKTLNGIAPLAVDRTELASIHALGANAYVAKAGINQTSEGKTVSGGYIDNMHAQDYVKFSIEFGVQVLFGTQEKVPYDDTGIAQVESVVRTVLQRAWGQGIIATVDGVGQYGTTFLTRAQTDAADRQNREYNGGTFWFDLAGAIHKTTIRGVVRF
jgi:hypothetical protein